LAGGFFTAEPPGKPESIFTQVKFPSLKKKKERKKNNFCDSESLFSA